MSVSKEKVFFIKRNVGYFKTWRDVKMDKADKIIAKLVKKGILTGSVLLGVQNTNSDIDYIIHPDVFEKIGKRWVGSILEYNDETYDIEEGIFRSYLCHCSKGNEYNFIVPKSDGEYKVWKFATKLIRKMPRVLWNDKPTRTFTFEFLKETAREKFGINLKQEQKDLNWGDDIPF